MRYDSVCLARDVVVTFLLSAMLYVLSGALFGVALPYLVCLLISAALVFLGVLIWLHVSDGPSGGSDWDLW